MRELSPARQAERKKRIQKVLETDPSANYHQTMVYIACKSWEMVQTLRVNLCITAWPFGPNPKEVNKSMRKYASEGLLHAAALGNIKIAEHLIQKMKADVNYQDKKGWTPLLWAISRKRLGMAEYLLRQGANPNFVSCCGFSPVFRALFDKVPLAFPLLRKYGADLDKPYYHTEYSKFVFPIRRVAYYPLMMACVQADDVRGRNVVDALLKAGANPDITYRKIPLAKMVEQNKMPSHAWLKDRLNQAIRERQ